MKRIAPLLLLFAALGCATTASPGQPNAPGNRMGAGSINALTPETVSLTTGTVLSQPQYVGSIDLIGDQLQTDGTSTAVCSAPVLLASNSYQSSVDSFSDTTKWFSVTLTTSPPSIASGANKIPISYPFNAWFYYRWSITCSAGTGTLTITHGKKGG